MRLCQPWRNIFIFSSFDVLQSLVISARVPLNGGSLLDPLASLAGSALI